MMGKESWTLLRSLVLGMLYCSVVFGQQAETFTPLKDGVAPDNFQQMWGGYDPRSEPLEIETMKEWEEDGVLLRVVRFRIGVFKGQVSRLAAIYGVPKNLLGTEKRIPGLVQIHGGGQYADYKACLMNAKRGYATVSIAWAGRISAPNYRVSPAEVKLFWDGKTDEANYRITTDWGAVDGYHAPSRNPKTQFPSAKPLPWTVDAVESPRNSPWFLCAVAARRALTFLEQQPNVDASRLGVYGHSMGGKLTVMTCVDPRVKAAAPSCGGISDRANDSELFKRTIGDDVSLRQISCPIVFLSPANDFHGRIGDLPRAVSEIKSSQWRVTCSPHRNHQDSAEYEVASLLWFDQHLKGRFRFPATPQTKLELDQQDHVPLFSVHPDSSRRIIGVDVFYTQHGKPEETRFDRENTINRFWRHANAIESGGAWTAKLRIVSTDKPLWAFANVTYELESPVQGAGYYYGVYTANTFNVSSLIQQASKEQLVAAGVKANHQQSLVIESFRTGWRKEWFTYRPGTWPRATHKLYDDEWRAPENAKLTLDVRCDQANKLVVLIDGHAAVVNVGKAAGEWQGIALSPSDFRNSDGDTLLGWENIRELKLGDSERLRPARGSKKPARKVGKVWQGADPEFRNLRWQVAGTENQR